MYKIIITLMLFSLNVEAKDIDTWECGETHDSETLVKATVNESGSAGKIIVAGVTYNAKYTVAGFNRRWDFEKEKNGSFTYAFVIKPNGDAFYVDFSGKNLKEKQSSSMYFECQKSE